MSKREQQREDCVRKLVTHVLATGLAETSLRQLADAAGVSDRMLLYYFDSKTDVLETVLQNIAADMAGKLNASLAEDISLPPAELLKRGAQLTRSNALSAHMRVGIEIFAAAGRDEEPYAAVATMIIQGFLAWIEQRLSTADPKQRKAEAAMLLSMIDGLAVLSIGAKKTEVDRALSLMIDALEH